MRMPFAAVVALAVGLAAAGPVAIPVPVAAQTAPAPDVTLRFSSNQIVLGEPVWVFETVHNLASVAVSWNPGDYCYMFAEAPITAEAPDATPTRDPLRPPPGQHPGGNCGMGGNTTELPPDASATWRYLLQGPFRFTRAGTYRVTLTTHPGRPFMPGRGAPPGNAVSRAGPPAGRAADTVIALPVTQTLTLVVLPPDDSAWLAREEQMAAAMERSVLSGHRAATQVDRDSLTREMRNLDQVRRGLVTQPAPGMQSVFEHWLHDLPNGLENDAILGLKNLDTKESCAALALAARTPDKPNSRAQELAADALPMGGCPPVPGRP